MEVINRSNKFELATREDKSLRVFSEDSDLKRSVNVKIDYPGLASLAVLTIGVCLAVFVVAIDRTIVPNAIPRITNEFKSSSDVGWYGSAYLLTSCAFQPIFGRVFADFDVKWSYIAALIVFEVGSLVCGIAPSSPVLIIGRAIAGLGCAGLSAGSFAIIGLSVPLARRPLLISIVGSIYGVGTACGPILGGVFTERVGSWRWIFYVNLPFGAVTLAILLVFFHPVPQYRQKAPIRERLSYLDLVGNITLVGSMSMLFLALQWADDKYPWGSATIIWLFDGFGITIFAFFLWQWHRGSKALLPPSILGQRTVLASFWSGFFVVGAFLVLTYYLPFWFQAVKGDSPLDSGIHLLPFVLMIVLSTTITGAVVSKTGNFNYPAIVGPVLGAVGSALVARLSVNERTASWVGLEIICAAGLGTALQQSLVAVQVVLPADLTAIGTALVLFAQNLAGAIFVSAGDSVLRNELRSGLETRAGNLESANITAVLQSGATEYRKLIPASQLADFLLIYNHAVTRVFIISAVLSGIAAISALGMEWKDLRQKASTG